MPTEEVTMMMSVVPGAMTGISTLMGGLVSINNVFLDMTRQIDATFGLVDSSIITASTVVAQFGWQAAQAFGEFEQGMKIVQMVSGQTVNDINQLKQAANQFSVEYRTDIDQITEGLQTLGRAGLNSASEQTEVLREGLSTAKLESRDLNGVLEELIQNTALLGGDLKTSDFGEQSKYINDLLVATSMTAPITTHDVSETLKYSGGIAAAAGANIESEEGKRILEDYMGAIAAFAQKGVTGSIAGTALRAFFNKPATQDSSVVDALSSIHLKPEYLWEDGGDTMKPVSEQIAIIKNQMDELNISTMDQLQIWSKIVGGKMGQQMMKLDSSDIKNLTKDIQAADNAGSLAAGTFQTFQSNMKEMTEQGQVAFRSFGENVARFLNPVLDIITKILEALSNPLVSMTLFGGLIAFLSLAVSKIKNVFSTLRGEFQQFVTYFQNDEKLLAMRPNTERGLNRKGGGGGLRVTTMSADELKEKHETPLTGKALLRELDLRRESLVEEKYDEPEIQAMAELAKQKKFENKNKHNAIKDFLKETYGESSPEYTKYHEGNIISPHAQSRLGIKSIDMNYMIDTLIREGKFDPNWAMTFLNPESEYYMDSDYLLKQHGDKMLQSFSGILNSRVSNEISPQSDAEKDLVRLNKQRADQVMARLEEGFGLRLWSVDGENFNPNLLTDNLEQEWKQMISHYEYEFRDDPIALREFQDAVKKYDEIYRKQMNELVAMYTKHLENVQRALSDPEQTPGYIKGLDDADKVLGRRAVQSEVLAEASNWQYTYGNGEIKNKALLEAKRREAEISQKEYEALMKEIEEGKGYPEGYSQDVVNAEEDMALQDHVSRLNNTVYRENEGVISPTTQDIKAPKGSSAYFVHINGKLIPLSEYKDYIKDNPLWVAADKDDEPESTGRDDFPTDSILPNPVNPQDIAGFGDMYENFDEYRKAIVTSFFKHDTFKTAGTAGDLILSPIDEMVNSILKGSTFDISREQFNDMFIRTENPLTKELEKVRIGDLADTGLDVDRMYDVFMYRYNYMRKQAEESLGMFSDYVSGGLKSEGWFKEMQDNIKWNDRGLLNALGNGGGVSNQNELYDKIAHLHQEGEIKINMDWIKENVKTNEKLEKLAYMLGIDPKAFYEDNKLNNDKLLNAIENFDKKEEKRESKSKSTGGDTTYSYDEHHDRMVSDDVNSFRNRRDRRGTTYPGASMDDLEYDYSHHHEDNEYGFHKRREWQDYADNKAKESEGFYIALNGEVVKTKIGEDVASLHDSLMSFKRSVDEVNKHVRSEKQADIVGPKGQKDWEYIPPGTPNKDNLPLPFVVEVGTYEEKMDEKKHTRVIWGTPKDVVNQSTSNIPDDISKKVDETTKRVNDNLKVSTAGTKAREFFEKSRPIGSIPTKQDLIEIIAKRDGISPAEYRQGAGESEYLKGIKENNEKLSRITERYNMGITSVSDKGFLDYLRAPVYSAQHKYHDAIKSIKDTYWNWGALRGLKEEADKKAGAEKGRVSKKSQLTAIGRNIFNSFFPNALMAAMEALTAVMELVRQAMEKYHSELKETSNNLKEAFTNMSSAESGLKTAYRKYYPDATDEDVEQFVLDIYGQLNDDLKTGKWLEKADIKIDKLQRYQPDEESEDGSYKKVEEEEKTAEQNYTEAIKENTGALYAAMGELRVAMDAFITKQKDAVWGIDGVSSQISDAFNLNRFFGWENSSFVTEGGPLLTASQADTNYSGNKEFAGLLLEDFHDSRGRVDKGLQTIFGTDAQDIWSSMSIKGQKGLEQIAKFAGPQGLSRRDNSRIQASMMYDKKSWQSLGKEIAKYELKTGKKASKTKDTGVKRLEGYVKKLATETGLTRLQVLQSASLQQMQDMYQVAQETIVPLSAQQAEAAANHYMYATGRGDSIESDTRSGALGVSQTAGIIASMVAVIAQAKAGEAYYQAQLQAGDPEALAAGSWEEYIKKGYDKNHTYGDILKTFGIDTNVLGDNAPGFFKLGADLGVISYDEANKAGDKWSEFFYSSGKKTAYTEKGDNEIATGVFMTFGMMGEKGRNPNWTDDQAYDYYMKKAEKAGYIKVRTDDEGNKIPELIVSPQTAFLAGRKNYANAITPALIEQYMGSGIGDTENESGGGGGSGSGDNDKDQGTRKERVDLVLCNKKEIPKLNVNLFKKPPTFTVLNKNFKLRDVKINTEDKPKAIMASIKNAFIDVQKRSDPKIIQDEEAEYDPVAATDGNALPSGSSKPKTNN